MKNFIEKILKRKSKNEANPRTLKKVDYSSEVIPTLILAMRDEAANETIAYNEGNLEEFYREMSRDLINRHGALVGVEYASHFPKFEIYFVYKDGFRIYSGERGGNQDIHFLALGYVGKGPQFAKCFLEEAGFKLTTEEISSIEPGDRIELKNGRTIIKSKEDNVDEKDMGDVKFLEEINKIVAGAPATYRHYEAPNKKVATNFLDKQEITTQSFFIVVHYPNGKISKDRMGVF